MKQKLFRIEKGIKLPAVAQSPSNGKPSMAGLTLAALQKGESFLVRDELEAVRAQKSMRDMNSAHRDVKAFASRKVKGGTGTRFWRIK